MIKKRIAAALLLLMAASLLLLSACSGSSAQEGGSAVAKQTLIKSQLNGDSVTISQGDVDKYTNTRFKVTTVKGVMTFMAYNYGGKLNVRADICPPCRSESFTLNKGNLVCDACGTVFNAKDGTGIKGACVRYAKEAAPYQIADGNIVMNLADLNNAYQNTLTPN